MISLILLAGMVSGQAVAEDWTQEDCDGVEHNMYATLDTGSVVVMEIVMLDGCMPCINAAHWMEPVIDAFNAAYDGRVQWYTFGYNDTYSCTALSDWKTENTIGCDAQFVYGADIASYYGGMGMPTIVVAGRASHTVYFNQFGFVPADTVEFAQAITYALGLEEPVVTVDDHAADAFQVYPNPATATIMPVIPATSGDATYTIYDAAGRICLQGSYTNAPILVQTLTPGIYSIALQSTNLRYRATFVRAL